MKKTPPRWAFPAFAWRLLLAAAVVAVLFVREAAAGEPCISMAAPPSKATADSWIFRQSRYSHDPETGGRVALFAMKPPIEPLDDPRLVTSGYSRSRTVLRGPDGSADTHYRVQSFGNGRGGLDAEWERFHDAWRGSTMGGGYFQNYFGPYFGFPGATPYGAGFGGGFGYGSGGYAHPGASGHFYDQQHVGPFGPGYGAPDAGRLDPDAADGFIEPRRRTPDRRFFSNGLPPAERPALRGPRARNSFQEE